MTHVLNNEKHWIISTLHNRTDNEKSIGLAKRMQKIEYNPILWGKEKVLK